MRKLTLSIFIVLTLVLSACTFGDFTTHQVVGSGKLLSKNFQFSDFTGVEVGGAFQTEIARADSFSVSVTTDDNLFDNLRVERQGTTLKINFAPGTGVRQMASQSKIKITMPTLETLTLSGATTGNISGFQSTKSLTIDVSGASAVNGSIDADQISLRVSGASWANLKGTTTGAKLEASGASKLTLGDFVLNNANVELSGGSSATISVKSKLDYNLSGASQLTYQGNPTIGKNETSGASSAKQR